MLGQLNIASRASERIRSIRYLVPGSCSCSAPVVPFRLSSLFSSSRSFKVSPRPFYPLAAHPNAGSLHTCPIQFQRHLLIPHPPEAVDVSHSDDPFAAHPCNVEYSIFMVLLKRCHRLLRLFPAILKEVPSWREIVLLSIYEAKLKTALLKTRTLRAANDFKRAVNALTALQLIGSGFIIR